MKKSDSIPNSNAAQQQNQIPPTLYGAHYTSLSLDSLDYDPSSIPDKMKSKLTLTLIPRAELKKHPQKMNLSMKLNLCILVFSCKKPPFTSTGKCTNFTMQFYTSIFFDF